MSNNQYNYNMWEDDGLQSNATYFNTTGMQGYSDQFQFQNNEYNDATSSQQVSKQNYSSNLAFFYEAPPQQDYTQSANTNDFSQFGNSNIPPYGNKGYTEYDEPPLLEELEIYPEHILQKIKLVLNPFQDIVPCDNDLGGPLIFYLCLAFNMFLSGGKINFGSVYGVSVTGCLAMYFLLKLMTESEKINLMGITSALGYSLLPVVLLSSFGIFFTLTNIAGYIMACISVGWASFAASKIICVLTEDFSQRSLIMYPCALLYSVFILLVIF